MSYIKLSNLQVLEATDIIRENPNVSFPSSAWTDEMLEPYGYAELHEDGNRPTVTVYQEIETGVPEKRDNKWFKTFIVRDLNESEINEKITSLRKSMVVSPFQAKMALQQAGLLDSVETLINDPATDVSIKLAWNNATEFRRTSPMIAALSSQLNLSDTQLDELFTNAATVTA